jgi:hypothetical protein
MTDVPPPVRDPPSRTGQAGCSWQVSATAETLRTMSVLTPMSGGAADSRIVSPRQLTDHSRLPQREGDPPGPMAGRGGADLICHDVAGRAKA